MLKETVIKALRDKFGDSVIVDAMSAQFASFPAKHPDVGSVSIEENGSELTIYVGDITHGHFGSYEPNLSDEEHGVVIASEVVDFLADLFADKYLLFSARWGGGWSRVEDGFADNFLTGKKKWFIWSGPIEPENLNL